MTDREEIEAWIKACPGAVKLVNRIGFCRTPTTKMIQQRTADVYGYGYEIHVEINDERLDDDYPTEDVRNCIN